MLTPIVTEIGRDGFHPWSEHDTEPAQGERHEQVIVVGAGPTGVMLAIELARRGVQVRVIDKQRTRSRESRAIGIHARTLEAFHQLGVVDQFLELGHRVDGVAVHSRARRGASVSFGSLESPYPFLLTLGQDETQRILDHHLQRLGVTIERGVTVDSVHQGTDAVELKLSGGGRSDGRCCHADWVVGCDGAHSIVRRCLGMAFEGSDYGQDWLMTEVNIDAPLRRDQFHLFSYQAAPMVAFPLPRGRWRVFLPQVPNRAGERPPPTIEELERLAAERGPGAIKLSDPTLMAAFRCYRRSTHRLRHGRVLLAGDAAHIHTPAGGQGMNTGLQDAFNLGWKLALVAQDQSPETLLDTYEQERVSVAAGVLNFTHGLVRAFTVASSRNRWLRDHLLPPVTAMPPARHRYNNRLSQLSHSYRGGALAFDGRSAGRGVVAAGDRLPNVSGLRLGAKQVSTLDLLTEPGHTLLVLTGCSDPRAGTDAVRRFARFAGIVRVLTITTDAGSSGGCVAADPELRAHRRYRALTGQLLLIRPDGHLACRASLDRADIPERYLERLTSGSGGDRTSVGSTRGGPARVGG